METICLCYDYDGFRMERLGLYVMAMNPIHDAD